MSLGSWLVHFTSITKKQTGPVKLCLVSLLGCGVVVDILIQLMVCWWFCLFPAGRRQWIKRRGLLQLWDFVRWLKGTKVFLQWWETSLTLDFPQMLSVNSNFRKLNLGERGTVCVLVCVFESSYLGQRDVPFPFLSAPPSSNVKENLSCPLLLLLFCHIKELYDRT